MLVEYAKSYPLRITEVRIGETNALKSEPHSANRIWKCHLRLVMRCKRTIEGEVDAVRPPVRRSVPVDRYSRSGNFSCNRFRKIFYLEVPAVRTGVHSQVPTSGVRR